MAKELKRLIVEELTKRYGNIDRCVLVNFTGVSAQLANEIRGSLRDANITLHVVKNSLMARALVNVGLESLTGMIQGTTAIATGAEDVVGLVKGLVDIADRRRNFRIAGGFGEGQPLTVEDIRRYAAIPSRAHLLAQLLGAALSPLGAFVRTLGSFTRNFVTVLDAVAKKRSDGPEEAAQPSKLTPGPKEGAAAATAPEHPAERDKPPTESDTRHGGQG